MKKTLPTAPSNRAVFYTKTLLVLLFCIGFSKATHAQVATTYAFSQTDTGLTYVPITGGTVYATATFPTTFVDTAPASVALGFTFTFNGANYTNVTITDNGYVTFGGTLPLATDYTPISSSTTFNGAISGFSQNLRSASNNAAYITPNPNITSTVRYQTIGLAPNRIFVVQYEDVVRTTRTGLLNFQILLYEGTNVIEILYNTFNPNTPTGLAGLANGQVGLRGATSADFNNRLLTTTNWTATQPGITNGDVIILRGTSPATFNADVTRFRWTPSNCLAPTALTAVLLGDNSTANFSWTAPIIPPAGGYDWEVRTAGNPGTGGAFASGNTASTSVAIPGLQVGTTYYFYVKSNCSSTWLPVNVAPSTITLTPVCAIATIPYTQNFESVTAPAIPACNSTVTPTGPAFATVDNTSANFFGFNNKNLTTVGDIAKNCWYFTQAIDFPAAGDYRLSYKYGGTRQQTFFQQKMRVFYGSVASVAGMTTQLADHPDIKNSPLTNVINFTVTTPGTYYIGFYGYANATNGSLQLDDISVAVSSCRPPTALTVPPAQITSNSALVSWTPPSSAPSEGYQYFLSTSNTSPVNTTTPTGTVAPGVTVVSLSGLNSSTTYYVWVRSNCGGSDVSSWSSVASFFTLFQPTYCLPSGNGNPQDPNGIINVTMGTINNTTGIELNNYGNYSNLS
ncbi:fibronectin type III domain-containing protein, partial [Flavobacterium sp.]|uniref:fibronectin type III domain-containing protein n=1 Tax=Flavobacterium sp. TaxID=239 RepID=UPI0037BFBD74